MKELTQILSNKAKITFWSILIIQLTTMLWASQDVGISADESRHITQAEKVYNYYKTNGEDKSALENTGRDPMQYNGQSFDNIMYWFTQKFEVKNFIEMRHFFIALLGWLIILLTGLLAKKIWDYEAAIIAIILLFISPRFIGHALNNNKDIPFAFGFILSFYGMYRFFQELPKIKIKYILLLALGIGVAISIRLAGLLSIAFLGLYSAVYYFTRKPIFGFRRKEKLHILKWLAIIVPTVSIAGYFIGIAYWPFMIEDPLKNIKIVLEATSSHPVALNQLFEGQLIQSNNLPHCYSLKYLAISYPLVVIVGMVLAFLLAPLSLKKNQLFTYFMVVFSFLFVFLWMSLKNSNFYGGIRHLTFIYPLAILIALFGYYFLKKVLQKFPNKYVRLIPIVLIGILSINPVVHLIKNYPYSYVYFNEIEGGVKNAYDKYETDYFQHSIKHATEWFKQNELEKIAKDSTKIRVATNDKFNTSYYLRDIADLTDVSYTRYYEKSKEDWNYAIFYCGYISPNQLTEKLWPPKGTIHTENVDGFPIAAVVKRVSHEDYKGFEALKKRQRKQAQKHFRNFLKVYPENEEVLEGYARTMLMQRDYDSTIMYANKSLKYNPRQLGALLLKASAQNNKKEFQEAFTTANEMTELKGDFAEGHYHKGYALKHLNKPNDALKEFQTALNYKKDYYQAYYQMGEILCNYKNYKKAIEIYSKVLEKRNNDFIAKISIAKNQYFAGNEQKAQQIINDISKNRQNRLEVVSLKCRMALDKNDLNAAANYLNMARNINYSSNLSVLRARFYLSQNNRQNAEKFLDEAVEQDATNREANELLKSVTSVQTVQQNSATKEEKPTESIMFQQPKKKKPNPLGLRSRK